MPAVLSRDFLHSISTSLAMGKGGAKIMNFAREFGLSNFNKLAGAEVIGAKVPAKGDAGLDFLLRGILESGFL
jgi:hypothetical protein